MTKPFTLAPLVDLAHQKNDAATRKLGKLNQQQQNAQAKLAALQQYRREYSAQFEEAAKQGMTPTDMVNFQNFIGRLDQAIRQQQGEIEKAKSSVQTGRHELMDTTRKMRSFDALADRHAENEKRLEAKAEQRQQDEQSGRFSAQHRTDKQDSNQ
ncbi:MAG: flagellar export protein FliJ [Sideroxydans sp.]|nr:flagellar export protein FliJ [Sideroxydans sp.]